MITTKQLIRVPDEFTIRMADKVTSRDCDGRPTSVTETRQRPGLYLLLLALQTAGAAVLFVNGVPIYRQMARDFTNHRPRPEILWWAIAAAVLIQTAYWMRRRLRLSPPRANHVLVSHLASFVARLTFILASSTFSLVFFVRFDQLALPPHRSLVLLVLLFSLYCYTLELEGLAKAFQSSGAGT